MGHKKIVRFQVITYGFLSVCFAVSLIAGIMLCLSGCHGRPAEDGTKDGERETSQASSEKIAECYAHIIKQADKDNTSDTLRLQQDIIDCLGAAGYVAVDIDNQIDMVNYKEAEKFCIAAEEGKKAQVMILLVRGNGGFVRYDLESEDGDINVLVSSFLLEDSGTEGDYSEEYTACSWKYTEKGYLFLEQYHMSGFDGAPGQTAIRIKPLDQTCRMLNQRYVLPLSYRGNNLLITDWDEEDCAALDFYDLYEDMYRMKYGKDVSYPDEYTRAEYEIPEKEFEDTIQSYLKVDSSLIRQYTVYHADTQTYRYRTRGLYDSPEPYEPCPEVTAYEKQKDGCLKLTVEAVWAMKNTDCAMTGELVVRPLKNGHFQYVSNRVVSVSDSIERLWYEPRLTDEEWDRLTE